jgi:uncharacterized membrane protein YqjE
LKPAGLIEKLSGVVAGARGLASSLLDLVGLETRRAGLALILMLACGAAGAMLFAAAWIGLMAALALWSVSRGISWEAALAVVGFATALAVAALLWLCVRLSRDLAFSATRRELRPKRLELV